MSSTSWTTVEITRSDGEVMNGEHNENTADRIAVIRALKDGKSLPKGFSAPAQNEVDYTGFLGY